MVQEAGASKVSDKASLSSKSWHTGQQEVSYESNDAHQTKVTAGGEVEVPQTRLKGLRRGFHRGSSDDGTSHSSSETATATTLPSHANTNDHGIKKKVTVFRSISFNSPAFRKLLHRENEKEKKKDRKSARLDAKGWSLEREGKLQEAEQLYTRHVLKSEKKHPGDVCVADDLERLVQLLIKEGRLEEAERLCRRALEIKESTNGVDDPATATAVVALARVLERQCDYSQAAELFQRAYTIRKDTFGEDHEETVTALAWIGDVRLKQNDLEAALTVFQQVVVSYERSLGENHINVASALNNLAGLYVALGEMDAALPLFQRSHDIYCTHLGPDHPHSLATNAWIEQLSESFQEPVTTRTGHRDVKVEVIVEEESESDSEQEDDDDEGGGGGDGGDGGGEGEGDHPEVSTGGHLNEPSAEAPELPPSQEQEQPIPPLPLPPSQQRDGQPEQHG